MNNYNINKGIGRTVEFKGLKAQYLFIFAGDNVYGDFRTADAAALKRAYATAASVPAAAKGPGM